MSLTIGEVIAEAKQELRHSSSPQLDAELLLCKVLNKPRSFIMAYRDQLLTGEQLTFFNSLLTQRAKQIPIAYLLGVKSFWSFDLCVTPDVLVPRPETELLVEAILDDYAGHKDLHVLDLGTGSGAIAIALAQEKPGWQVTACDVSPEALSVAQLNAANILSNGNQIHFLLSDWMQAFDSDFYCDVIVSNPPYLASDDPHLINTEISHEPRVALVANNNGLAAYEAIAQQAGPYLNPNGRIYLEHGNTQAHSISEIFSAQQFQREKYLKDFSGHERVSVFVEHPSIGISSMRG